MRWDSSEGSAGVDFWAFFSYPLSFKPLKDRLCVSKGGKKRLSYVLWSKTRPLLAVMME